MIIPKEIMKELHIVPEKMIIDAAEYTGGENSFRKLLHRAQIFRDNGCNPIYLSDNSHLRFVVTSEETIAYNKLH